MSGSSRADIVSVLAGAPVVPVITMERVEDAVPLARALTAGGIRAIEITLRTPAAREAAAAIIKDVPEAVVGIGTVLTPADLSDAERLGAHFAVSPGCSTALLQAATRSRVPFLPGAQTASEVMACLAHGFDTMKLFPAVPSGGLAMLRALAGPFPSVRFCPTGGIGQSNAAEWLAESNVVAVGGSWLAPPSDILKGDWTAISNRAASAKALRRR